MKLIVIPAPDMWFHQEKKLNSFFYLQNNYTVKLKNIF